VAGCADRVLLPVFCCCRCCCCRLLLPPPPPLLPLLLLPPLVRGLFSGASTGVAARVRVMPRHFSVRLYRHVYNTLLPAAASSRAFLHAAGSGFPLRARAPLLQHARAAVVLKARLGVLLPADAQMLAAACSDVCACGPRASSSLVRRLAASAATCFGTVPLSTDLRCASRSRRRGRARRPSSASPGRCVPSRRTRCARRRVGPAPAALVRLR
jgi:hypothetical protein